MLKRDIETFALKINRNIVKTFLWNMPFYIRFNNIHKSSFYVENLANFKKIYKNLTPLYQPLLSQKTLNYKNMSLSCGRYISLQEDYEFIF